MPNWCNNELTITGPKRERDLFVKHAHGTTRFEKEKVLCEDQFIPYPKEYADKDVLYKKLEDAYWRAYKADGMEKEQNATNAEIIVYGKKWKAWHDANPRPDVKDGYNSGGYDWCCKNWGTKWGFVDPELHRNKGEDFYTFNTAWSPPVPLIRMMSSMFPTLEFHVDWEEEGGDKGEFTFKAGDHIKFR